MDFVASETELTSAFTDLLLAILCGINIISIYRSSLRLCDDKRSLIWISGFICLGVASLFGFFAHGFVMSKQLNDLLWQPLSLGLGLTVSIFVAGVLMDLKEPLVTRRLIFGLLCAGVAFYSITLLFPDSFKVFLVYEASALLFALLTYIFIWFRDRQGYSLWMTAGIAFSIAAAVIQASGSMRVQLVWLFDHNGIFHLVQMVGVIALLKGILSPRKRYQVI